MARTWRDQIVISLLLPALAGSPRNRPTQPPVQFAFGAQQNILWIGAHPDDEALVAPFLGVACKEFGARCTFLVMTRGERGTCGLAGGCFPDLGPVRAAEMQSAAEALGGQVIQWTLPNTFAATPEAAETAWTVMSGGREGLVRKITEVGETTKPTLIITFDPVHGSTCHPEHRAASLLVRDAIGALNTAEIKVLYLETRLQTSGEEFVFSSAVRDNPSLRIDAARKISPDGRLPWEYLLLDARRHRSQFTDGQVLVLSEIPRQQRYVDFARPAVAPTVSPCP